MSNELVSDLRKKAVKYKGIKIMLPVELVRVIRGDREEEDWIKQDIGEVLQYIADMLEK